MARILSLGRRMWQGDDARLMFPLLRYFSLTSAGAIIAVTAILAYYQWDKSQTDLEELTGRSNASLARAFANTIWPQYMDQVVAIENGNIPEAARKKIVEQLDDDIRSLVNGLPVLKVRIYGPKAINVYSSEPAQIGQSKAKDEKYKYVVENKIPTFRMSERETFFSFEGIVSNKTVVETYLPIVADDGTIEGVFELYHDVTEQSARLARVALTTAATVFFLLMGLYVALFFIVRRANHVLKQQYGFIEHNERRFADFAEASSDWLWETDQNHRFIYMSPRVSDVTGVPVEFHIGKTREELAGETISTPKWQAFLAKLENHEEFKRFEYARKGPNGRMQYLNISGVPIFDRNGNFTGYRGTGNDVTQQHETTRRAVEAETLLRTSIDALGDAFVIYDADDRLVLCNEKYKTYYPRSRDLIEPGAKFEDILREGVRRGEFIDAIGDEENWINNRLEWHRIGGPQIEQNLADGRWLRIAEQKTETGETVGFRVDITELKRAQVEAEAASAAKSEFLASMSHEIRTPMTGVIGFADMLLDDNLSSESETKVRKIKEVATSLMTIINDILDISKLDADKMEIEMINFRPGQLAEDVVNLFVQTCPEEKKAKLEITTQIASDFPEIVRADPTRLRQILVNLMGNGVKFTDAGSVILECAHDEAARLLKFDIVDTGIGMTDDVIERLFGEFFQADASISRTYHGTGLGLSICKRLIDLMGGSIQVKSQIAQGSRFSFTLPYEPVEEGAIIADEGRSDAQRFMGSRELSILVAEDNKLNQVIIKALLDKMGHEASFVADGSEAVSAVNAADYDLILMDVRMPVLSGPDATRQIRRLPGFKSMIPIIALTADVMAENKQSYFDAGMNECVGKPINPRELADAMNRVLGETINMMIGSDEN